MRCVFFPISKLFWLVFAPSHLLVWMAVASVALLPSRFDHTGRRLAVTTAALFVSIGIWPLNVWLIRPPGGCPYARPTWPVHVDGVLTLSGGLDTRILNSRGVPTMEPSESRLVATDELAHRYLNARIVFSGGPGAPIGDKFPEAKTAR